jgi:DNA mismatch endonuclease (patch repair protein)
MHSTKPSNNHEFWEKKLKSNNIRDKLVPRTLRGADWVVVRIWEHDLRENEKVANKIQKWINKTE